MLSGRAKTLSIIRKYRTDHPDALLIWFHAASAGEFEQALPVIRMLKEKNPDLAVAVSFFSPSGYELRHNHPLVDVSFYLLHDFQFNGPVIFRCLKPAALVLVKYEFWYNLLRAGKRLEIPVISICCILKKEKFQGLFSGWLMKKCLALIHYFFVQNVKTSRLLTDAGIMHFTLNGDTRVDRVLEIKEIKTELPWLGEWKGQHKLMVIGSAWAEDVMFLHDFLRHAVVEAHGLWRVLIAPHEISGSHFEDLKHALRLPFELFSDWQSDPVETDILILNTVGMLAKTYRYADAAWIGGGFKTGLHNTLEAAVYGIPVGFGPQFQKFQEACDLTEMGLARSFSVPAGVWEFFQSASENPEAAANFKRISDLYFERQKGASEVIVTFLSELFFSAEKN
jgi:3-deoxy-D-manno-octulosonic-acid transferase